MSLLSLCGFMSDAIADIWMSIWLSLNDFVYSIISVLYQVFEGVANVNLFSEATFKKITSRIYIIMGIAMLFIFAYNLVLMIINPEEKKSTGQTTKIVKETIISLVLVILLPTIFNYMSIFQRHVLESGILSQIILGDTGGTSAEKCDYSQYTIYNEYDIGNVEDTSFLNWKTILSLGIYQIYLSTKDSTPTSMLTESCKYYSDELSPSQRGAYALPATIFSAFYYPTRVDYNSCEDWIEACKDDKNCSTNDVSEPEDKEMCAYYVYDVKLAKYMGNIAPFNSESKFYSKVKADDGTFEFNGLLALAAGVLALYMFVCYTIAIGTRVAKLGFLQIISPIAVMMRIIPKQKEAMFDKWLKNLINTYLDVFIRLIIIYFSLFAISLVPDVIATLFSSIEGSWYVAALSTVVVILGILMFAQKAPELFKEFFGSVGNFALKSPSKQLSENKLAMGGLGMAKGAIGGSLRNGFKSYREGKGIGGALMSGAGGLIGGARRGARAGYGSTTENFNRNVDRSIEETTDKRRERAKYKALHGGTVGGAIKGHFGDAIAAHSAWTGFDGGRDILDTIKYEEDVISHFDDYESMYKSGGYATMDARLKEMKAAKKSNQGYDGIPLSELGNAIQNLEKEMQQSRIEAIKKNVQNAAYVAYEFSQSLNSDPKELARIRDKLKLSDAQIDQLKGLQIKNNKVVDANGNAVSEDLIVKLLEGEDIAYTVGTDGKVEVTSTSSKGLNGSSGDLKGQLSADKLSVAYKHQTKLEQERKDKK